MSRKVKGSNNREKARAKVARIHSAIADSRTDFLHKLTTRLVRENQTIAVVRRSHSEERASDLAVKNMMKNHKLALAIADASWSELIRQLEYKCLWVGRTLVKIDRWFPSSKRCGNCGHVVDKLPLDVREWECPECETHHDRDINAAQNILAAGLAVFPMGFSPSVIVSGANIRPDRHESKGQLRDTCKGKKQKPKSC